MGSMIRAFSSASARFGGYEEAGKVIASWTDQNGVIGLSRFDGNVWRHVLVDGEFSTEIHNTPAVTTDSSGRVLAAYSNHLVTGIYLRKSTTPYGVDLEARSEIVPVGSGGVSYPTFAKTSDGRIWLFFNRASSSERPVYCVYSDDDGETWSSETMVWSSTGNTGRAYYAIEAVGNELLFTCNLGHATDDGLSFGAGHAYFMRHDGTGWKRADGTAITLPAGPSSTDKAYDAAPNSENAGFAPRLFKDSSGRYGFYSDGYASGGTQSHYLCRYEAGSGWTQNRFISGVDTGGGAVPTLSDPYTIHLLKLAGDATTQVFQGVSTDGGATWDYTQITGETWSWPIEVIVKVAKGDTCPYLYNAQVRTSNDVWSSHLVAGMDVNHWMDDFNDSEVGAQPRQWSRVIGMSSSTFATIAHPDDATKNAGRLTKSAGGNAFVSFALADEIKDGEMLVRIRPEVNTTNSARVGGRMTGYTQTTMPNYWIAGLADLTKVRISVNGSQQGADASYSVALNTWHYMRLKLDGAVQKFRIWPAGEAEPSTWQYELTSGTQNVAGDWGIYFNNATTNIVVDWVSFARGSNTALRADQVADIYGAELVGAAAAVSSASGWLPDMGGAATSAASASAALTTAIPLAGASAAIATATGSLSTSIALAGSSASVSVANGALTTEIRLDGAALAAAAATAALQSGAADLSGDAAALASAVGALTTQIRLSGAAVAQAIAEAGLTTGSGGLDGAAHASASASGLLTTQIPLVGEAVATAGASGSLGSPILLSGVAASASNATGDLTVRIALEGYSLAQAIGSGVLTTQIRLDGVAIALAAASGLLSGTEFVYSTARTLTIAAQSRDLTINAEDRTLAV